MADALAAIVESKEAERLATGFNFTDPGYRVPFEQREMPHAAIWRVKPDGTTSMVADFEYPNGLAFSPDERRLYVANTRWAQYIHELELDSAGNMVRRRIFAE